MQTPESQPPQDASPLKGTKGYYGIVPVEVMGEPDANGRVPMFSPNLNRWYLPRASTLTLRPNPSHPAGRARKEAGSAAV